MGPEEALDDDDYDYPDPGNGIAPFERYEDNQSDSETVVGDQAAEKPNVGAGYSLSEEVKNENDEGSDVTPAPSEIAPKAKKGQKGQRGKGGRARGGKKSGGTAKQPASKKRKVSHDEDEENEENEDPNGEAKKEPQDDETNPKPRGRGRVKGETSEAWNDTLDRGLLGIIKRHTGNDPASTIPWKDVYADFTAVFGNSKKSLKAAQMRWFNHLKHGTVELTDEQITHFKQAVKDINGGEKNAAIAWRYQQLSGASLGKGTVATLLKSLSIKS
ncbi:hypothetical protein TWF696_000802 [Orbilia brochopaga]|uniref:Myb-like domain-containing protein n=1 Tax=Orbilia brochopaga TaxID=3140254 RepID=A0AAV9VF04_9PEZI